MKYNGSMKNEKWLPVPDARLSEHYKISNMGRVLSLKKGKKVILKPHFNKDRGYFYISCQDGQYRKNFILHRLVASLFVPFNLDCPIVDHKDFDRRNNKASNLEWVNHKENSSRASLAGRLKTPFGENSFRAKIKNKDISKIFKLYESGTKTQKEIGEIFGMKACSINLILSGKRWGRISERLNK